MTPEMKLKQYIPGGAHTYSRGDDQFSANTPGILSHGKGYNVYDLNNTKYLDYGMGLRSVGIGYSEPLINQAAVLGLEFGNNLTRPTIIEAEAAELFCSIVKSCDMVKFCKNGSSATSAAVRLARAFTGRNKIMRCAQHPFFSYDDWFIGSTVMNRGVAEDAKSDTLKFEFNNIKSIEKIITNNPNEIACIILEPAATECPFLDDTGSCCGKSPCGKIATHENNFLKEVQALCKKNGIVFILDETITGFRWSLSGAQEIFGVSPDLTVFGKAMANGFSVAALGGKRDIMELGSIDVKNAERVFLLSSTHGAEMSSLNAFIATTKFYQDNNVISHIWDFGSEFRTMVTKMIEEFGLDKILWLSGPTVLPYFAFKRSNGDNCPELRTLFLQEMIKNGIMVPWISFCYRHDDEVLKKTKTAVEETLAIISRVENYEYKKLIKGEITKPVFRKFN